jgi:hypothetical protein
MKSFFLIVLLAAFIQFETKAQKTEAEYKKQYQNHWTASQFVDALDTLASKGKIKFVKSNKSTDWKSVRGSVLNFGAETLTQANLLSGYFCSMKHEDSFKKWNRLYPKLSQKTFDSNCMALMFIMTLDGTLNDE